MGNDRTLKGEYIMNKYGLNQVVEVSVFDTNDNLVTTLNTIKESSLYYDENFDSYILHAVDALLDKNLLRFLGEENKQTDFEKQITNQKTTSITIKKRSPINVKLIAKSSLIDKETRKGKDVTIVMPNASILSKPVFTKVAEEVSAFDVVFQVAENKFGEYFTIVVED